MSGETGIQWTASDDGTPGKVWNPVVGCTRVSAGCDHCYAFQLHDQRHIAWKRGRWSTAPAQYHQPFSKVQLLPERLGDPLRWRKPTRVFVNSMSDLWHPDVPDEFIEQVFAVMWVTQQHTYQILTKRPERMRAWLAARTPVQWEVAGRVEPLLHSFMRTARQRLRVSDYLTRMWPLQNVWLGVSVENQTAADERIPLLLQTPAAVRFLSCEPLLGPVNLFDQYFSVIDDYGEPSAPRCNPDGSTALSWVIAGGESGPHAREMDLGWAHTLRIQCMEAGVPFFMKQLGSVWARELRLRDRHGGDSSEWPSWVDAMLYQREWPQERPEKAVAPW